MARTSVYATVAVQLIIIHLTVAFSSNIHEQMTSAEKFAVFGSATSVPEYQVFNMTLPGARHRRETNVAIKLTVKIEGKKINLNLKPTAGYLATKYTPVWSASTDKNAYQQIRYDPLSKAMSKIGEFKMYQDVENSAAIIAYTDRIEESMIDGIVNPNFVIRSLPKRLMGKTLEDGYHFRSTYFKKKRSVTSDEEAKEETGHFAVFKVPAASPNFDPSAVFPRAVDPDDHQRQKRAGDKGQKRKRPKVVYPKILIVLDYNTVRHAIPSENLSHESIVETLRYTLNFWNGVDLLYRTLDKPRVHLNIAGIIIAIDEFATPYIAANVLVSKLDDRGTVVSRMGKYFYKEKDRFPMNGYDMIIAMTTIQVCGFTDVPCYSMYHYPNGNTACPSRRQASQMKSIENNGIVSHNWAFTGIIEAAKLSAYILGINYDYLEKECNQKDGYIMGGWRSDRTWNFKWSKCSQRYLTEYFLSDKSACVKTKPVWTKTVGKLLPGRWMSMDGQCRNEGFAKSCKLKGKSMCATQSCQVAGSTKCSPTRKFPLPGSKCASNKHCSTKKKCVPN